MLRATRGERERERGQKVGSNNCMNCGRFLGCRVVVGKGAAIKPYDNARLYSIHTYIYMCCQLEWNMGFLRLPCNHD